MVGDPRPGARPERVARQPRRHRHRGGHPRGAAGAAGRGGPVTQISPDAAGDGIAAFYGWLPDRMYSWDAPAGRTGGVTDDPALAAGHVHEALRDAPAGTVGTVHRVALSGLGGIEYQDLGEVARARRAAGGDVVWQEEGLES